MGVEARAVVGIGLTFDSVTQAGEWFLENFKGTLTEDERELIGDSFAEFIESTRRKGLPKWECLNLYSGDYFALHYSLKGQTPASLREAVDKAVAAWGELFQEEADFIQEVLWY